MKAKLIRVEGTIEAEGAPEELARLFKDFCGQAQWHPLAGVAAGQIVGIQGAQGCAQDLGKYKVTT